MSIRFNWPKFSPHFLSTIQKKLSDILATAPPDPALVGIFEVKSIRIGDEPPKIALLAIEELTLHSQTLLIQFEYTGSAAIEITNDIQLNKLFIATPNYLQMNLLGGSALSHRGTVMPLNLKVSQIRLEGKLRVSVLEQGKRVQLQLMANPLKSVDIKTNFDEHLNLVGNMIRYQILDTLTQELEKNLIQNKVDILLSDMVASDEESGEEESSLDEEDEEILELEREENVESGEKVAK